MSKMVPTCDRCGYQHPNYGRGANLSPEDNDFTTLLWRVNKGRRGRSERVRIYVSLHLGASAIEVIRALCLHTNPYGRSYSEPVWHAISDGVVFDAAEGKAGAYRLYPTDLELASMIAQAEAEPDLVNRMDMIDRMGERIRKQIADAADWLSYVEEEG